MLCTFTEKAAFEMRDRLAAAEGVRSPAESERLTAWPEEAKICPALSARPRFDSPSRSQLAASARRLLITAGVWDITVIEI
jgi:hypothetical protein